MNCIVTNNFNFLFNQIKFSTKFDNNKDHLGI